MDNRGKLSVGLDLHHEADCEAMERLLASADIFVSNLRNQWLENIGYSPEDIVVRHPHIVACILTGYGRVGPDSNKPGYEGSGFWARSTAAAQHTADGGGYPPIIAPGFGDHTTALSAVGGILAALHAARESGRGSVVETSLLRTGM
jgi:crotonobetainyl-CoA:carnitine CoA-transferase CaiB-like acyl-CoA transferase